LLSGPRAGTERNRDRSMTAVSKAKPKSDDDKIGVRGERRRATPRKRSTAKRSTTKRKTAARKGFRRKQDAARKQAELNRLVVYVSHQPQRRGAGKGRSFLLSVSNATVTSKGTVLQYGRRLSGPASPTNAVFRMRSRDGT
jgi:hypothetical protein